MHRGDRQPELSLRKGAPGAGGDDARDDSEAAPAPADRGATPPARGPHFGRPQRGPSIRRIGSRELMGASGQLVIRHAGDDYHLRVTSKGKLILTK